MLPFCLDFTRKEVSRLVYVKTIFQTTINDIKVKDLAYTFLVFSKLNLI